MTDIVERLRADGGELAAEAAAEIERLRTSIEILQADVTLRFGKMHPAAREADETFRVTEQPPNVPR